MEGHTVKPWTKIRRKRRKTPQWHDLKRDYYLSAGGIIPRTSTGMWLISEYKNGSVEWTDMGGKYRYDDGTIYTTIAREFNEETYFSAELRMSDVIKLCTAETSIYIDGFKGVPVYLCCICSILDLNDLGAYMDPEIFEKNKNSIQASNPKSQNYTSISLNHFTYGEVQDMIDTPLISTRLNQILTKFEFP